MEVHWKIWFSGGGGSQKTNIWGDCLKRGAWAVCRFKGDLAKTTGGVFDEGLIPTMA